MFAWMRKASRSDLEDLHADMRRLKQEWADTAERIERLLARLRMRDLADRKRAAPAATPTAAVGDPISQRIWARRNLRRAPIQSSAVRDAGPETGADDGGADVESGLGPGGR